MSLPVKCSCGHLCVTLEEYYEGKLCHHLPTCEITLMETIETLLSALSAAEDVLWLTAHQTTCRFSGCTCDVRDRSTEARTEFFRRLRAADRALR